MSTQFSIGTGCDLTCQYCGRPVIGVATWGSSGPYHPECTRGPGDKTNFYSCDPAWEIEVEELKRRIEKLESDILNLMK